jgi:hypothetical protein
LKANNILNRPVNGKVVASVFVLAAVFALCWLYWRIYPSVILSEKDARRAELRGFLWLYCYYNGHYPFQYEFLHDYQLIADGKLIEELRRDLARRDCDPSWIEDSLCSPEQGRFFEIQNRLLRYGISIE